MGAYKVSLAIRVCTKCGIGKPATKEYFSVCRRDKDGFQTWCKECKRGHYADNREEIRLRHRVYHNNNRERILGQKREYRRRNHDEILSREKKRRQDNRENIRASSRKHYWNNRDRIIVQQSLYRESNRETLRAWFREFYETNRDKLQETFRTRYATDLEFREKTSHKNRRWRKNNPEVTRAIDHRKRAKRRSAPGMHTADDIRRIHKEQDGHCFWCDVSISEAYHVDHYIPLFRGGSNDPDNLVIACAECNLKKGALMPWDFLGRNEIKPKVGNG